ncbi:MAG: hypothetical protein JSR73_11525 [Proteobacteria bacterium]|nr:hypothetical protein [Pseudomonadota bacterium]
MTGDRFPSAGTGGALLAATAAAWSAAAVAGAWSVEPTVAASTEYDTNPLLRPDEARAGSALVANASMPIAWDDGARHLEIKPSARLAHAGGDSAIGASGYYVSVRGDAPGERSDLAATARWGDDSTAIREPAAGTLIRSDLRQALVDADLGWSYAATERIQSRLEGSWQSLRFADEPRALENGLYSYKYATASAEVRGRLTSRTQIEWLTQASRYDVSTSLPREYSYSTQLGVVGSLTELWSYEFRYGRSRTEDTGAAGRSTGTVYLARLAHRRERLDWAVSVGRSIQPSGFGQLAESLERSGTLHWSLTERVALDLGARRSDTKSTFYGYDIARRHYESLSGGAAFEAAPEWTVRAQLSYQQVRVDPTLFETLVAGHGYGVSVSIERRFRRSTLT